jgi:DNA-binding NarL/FixJ family response regulator
LISVLIVDDQDLVREGLRMLLEAEPDLVVAGRPPTAARHSPRPGSWTPT